jgi:hypothetical protein
MEEELDPAGAGGTGYDGVLSVRVANQGVHPMALDKKVSVG